MIDAWKFVFGMTVIWYFLNAINQRLRTIDERLARHLPGELLPDEEDDGD